mmetsp:Transcript_10643/g.23052  ORF Transcript_10643/g.23052 Transcript_10643/m.23052 type:complete len:423 (+) Transcript_10643:189-1457(+)
MTKNNRNVHHRDGGREAARAISTSRQMYEKPEYDPDWAICPDGGSNNRWDYERHFPTCQGHKCLYSCDAAWNYYQGLDAPLDFSYEITIKSGVSGSILTDALLEMEERMLINMATAVGIDNCICSTMNGERGGYRSLRAGVPERKVEKQSRQMEGMPEGQDVVNLSNLIKDDILAGKCKKAATPEGEACIRVEGHMRFVHTVDVDNEETRRLSYEGALSQLNELLFTGMQDGSFLNQDIPEEERIITGMTFIPEVVDGEEGDLAEGGEGDSDSWGTAGTAPINPGEGLETVSEDEPPEDTIPIGPPSAPTSSTTERGSSVSYGLYGLFALLAIVIVAAVGLFLRRRQKKDDDESDEEGEDISSGGSSAGPVKEDGSFPKQVSAYDLTEVVEVETEEIGASESMESKMADEEKVVDGPVTSAA